MKYILISVAVFIGVFGAMTLSNKIEADRVAEEKALARHRKVWHNIQAAMENPDHYKHYLGEARAARND